MPTHRARRSAWALALLSCAVAAACSKSADAELRALKDEACACKSKACAVEVGGKLTQAAAAREFGEAKVAMEASACLAALGE